MKKEMFLVLLIGLLTACSGTAVNQEAAADSVEVVAKDSVEASAEVDDGLVISIPASLNFTDKADADRFFEAFLKSGVVDCGGMYVVVEQEIPAGEVIFVESMRDYNGKYSFEKLVFDPERGFYTFFFCWFA